MDDDKEPNPSELNQHNKAVSRLEERKLNLEIKKLALEAKKLASENDVVGRFASRIWPMLATMLTLFVSVAAIWISISTQEKQRLFEERQKHAEHLADALKLATDGTGEVDRRIAGIWQLSSAWKNPDDFGTAASVLTAELALPDKDRFARCAAADVLGRAMSTVDPEHRKSLAGLLFGDTEGNLGLITHQNYVLRQTAEKQNTSTSASCESALDATKEAIRKNWTYLRGVNLNATDLSHAPLYSADLARSLFFGAALQGTNLRCANLIGARLEDSRDATTADFTYANVTDLLPVVTRQSALNRGALQMSDNEWQEWRANDFRLASGKSLLNGLNGTPASCLAP
jgi:hypothetical protein